MTCLYFYLDIKHEHRLEFSNVGQVACRLIKDVHDSHPEDKPIFFGWCLLVAHTALLRLLRSEIASSFDTLRYDAHMAMAIDAMTSLGAIDLNMADWATMMRDLERSTRTFYSTDSEGPDTRLRIRHRLFASPVLDAVQWWREDFETPENKMVASFFF